ncbi:MAG TPA: hypothetical protein VFI24_28420 [Pyrinomonadaceae bacterium]|nr:hypothetical protein [Pyrinomonadaceae bacterium]
MAPQPVAPIYAEIPQPRRRSSSPSISSIGPFNRMSDAFGPAVTLFTKNIWLITKLVLVIVTPFEVFKALSFNDIRGNWQLAVGTIALQIFCNVLIAPALIYAMMKVLQTGVAPGINESYRWGLSKLGKLSLCAVLVWILTLLGTLLLIIPGIILYLAFEIVYPIAVLEGRSVTEVLKRSYKLTEGHRWKILGATFCMSCLINLASMPLTFAAALAPVFGVSFWGVQVVAAIIGDIFQQASIVLSLVIYLSILGTLESRPSVIE